MPAERLAAYCPRCGAPTALLPVQGRERPVCTACQHVTYFDPKVAVAVVVVEHERVLLVQRAHDPGKGLWALPAGFVDYDEDPAEAAVREVHEETGIYVHITGLVDITFRPDADGLADLLIIYEAAASGGCVQCGDDATAAGWFAADHLPPIGLASTHRMLARWRQQLQSL
jgi:ADP-ribose pyrophosphatase YjhB (NUDIX family)